jgi:hypothetical protein
MDSCFKTLYIIRIYISYSEFCNIIELHLSFMQITLVCLPTLGGIVPKYGEFIEAIYQNMD